MTVSKGSSTTLRNWMKSSARVATGCSTWLWHPSILPTSSPDLVHMAWRNREKRRTTGSGSSSRSHSERISHRQRNGAEHSVLSFRQWNLRADLESELRRAGRDYHCGNGGCRGTGTIL